MKTILLIMGLILVNLVEAKQKYYKWTDADGNIHYTESKPENQQVSEVKVNTSQPKITKNNDSTNDEVSEDVQEKSPDEKAVDEYNKKEETRIAELNNKNNCQAAKENLATLQKTQRVRKKDKDTGEYVRMDDNQRMNALKSAKKLVQDVCK